MCLFLFQYNYADTVGEINRCRLVMRKKHTFDDCIASNDELNSEQRTISFSNLQVSKFFYSKFIFF